MAGHSHWKQIKQHKGAADQKRGARFSKLLRAVSAAARGEPNPDFNPTLRSMVRKAHAANVPSENITRAIQRGSGGEENLEPLLLEAYGPGGAALLIDVITDRTNHTIMEIKLILKDHHAKPAEPGSVRWAFEPLGLEAGGGWRAKFPQSLSPDDQAALTKLAAALKAHGDVHSVVTNAAP